MSESPANFDLSLFPDSVYAPIAGGPTIRILGVRIDGGELRVSVMRDGEVESLLVRDLLEVAAVEQRSLTGSVPDQAVDRTFAWLLPEKQAAALDMERHLIDVIYGRSGARGHASSPYDADTTTETQRRAAKVKELGISQATMTRRLQAYRDPDRGITSLVPHSSRALKSVGIEDVDPEVLAIVKDFVSGRTVGSKKTLKNEYALLLDELRQRGLVTLHEGVIGPDGRPVPVADKVMPYKRFRNLIRHLDRGREPRSAKTRQQQNNRPRVDGYRHRGLDFADRIEMDSTPVDVFVQGPDGPVKAHAVFAKCVSTKYLWVRVTAGAPRGRDLALLLWDMAGGEQTFTTGEAYHPAQSVPALPRNVLSLNVWRNTGAPPASLPGAIVLDHGAEEENHRLIRYCAQIGVTILWAATREPTDKAYVESVISEFARMCQLIPGHKGNAVENRPSADPARIPTIEMLQAAVAAWQQHYVQQEHTGLPHPHRSGHFHTPLEAVQMSLTRGIPLRGMTDPTRALGLMEHASLTPQDDGITRQRRRYTCPGYDEIIDASLGRDGRRRKITFYFDPNRPGRMYWPVPGTCDVKVLMTAEEAGGAFLPFADVRDHWLGAAQGRKTATPNEDGVRRAALVEAMQRAMDDVAVREGENVIPIVAGAMGVSRPSLDGSVGASGWDLTDYADLFDERYEDDPAGLEEPQ